MKNLPYLVYNSDEAFLKRRIAARTNSALALLIDFALELRGSDRYVVLHDSLDYFFDFGLGDIPPGAIDARDGDAVGHALANPGAVVVSLDGIYIGNKVTADRRFAALKSLARTTARLGGSALSGTFFGLSIDEPGATHVLRRPPEPLTN